MNMQTVFDYQRPRDLSELHQLVGSYLQRGLNFRFSGGGTDLMPLFKSNAIDTDALISLSAVKELSGIAPDGDTLRIGAGTTLSELAGNSRVREVAPALTYAASRVGSEPIRNQATIGGNVLVTNRCIYYNQTEQNRTTHHPCFKANGDFCHVVKSAKRGVTTPLCQARFVSDTVPVLLLLDAELEFAGPKGRRRVTLSDFYEPEGLENHKMDRTEVLLAVHLRPRSTREVHYEKLAIRQVLDFPSLGVAVSRDACGDMGVALTGVQTHPGHFRYRRDDFDSDESMLQRAVKDAKAFTVTYNQDFFPRAYRKDMLDVFIRRGWEAVAPERP